RQARARSAPSMHCTSARILVCPLLCGLAMTLAGCGSRVPGGSSGPTRWDAERQQMVTDQLAVRGIHNERVLAAMGRVPRHEFVPDEWRNAAYDDRALPIGE